MRRLLIVPFAALTLAVAGCGGDSATVSSSGDSSASAPAEAPAAGGAGKVGMKNIQFTPKDITVKVGEKVTWTDEEDIPHNVTADEGADFKSETFGKDGTFSYTPKKAGVIKYECTIHPGMVGTITVEG